MWLVCCLSTHWGRVTHICVNKLSILGSDNGLAPTRHYLKQCWIIFNCTLRNKLQWNFNRNSNIFIHENAFESVVCEMAFILSRPQCVNEVWVWIDPFMSIKLLLLLLLSNYPVTLRHRSACSTPRGSPESLFHRASSDADWKAREARQG